MITQKKYAGLLIFFIWSLAVGYGQENTPHDRNFRIQYGLFQFNKNQQQWLDKTSSPLLSLGLTFQQRMSAHTAFNLTGRHYQWNLANNEELKTYAGQAMVVFNTNRLSNSLQLNRLTPYLGIGFGFEQHHFRENAASEDSTFTNFYLPLELGLQYNLSQRFSIGVFAEYKIASAKEIKELINTPSGNLSIANAAGVTLVYHFGKRKKQFKAPVIYTLPQVTVKEPVTEDTVQILQPAKAPEIVQQKEIRLTEKQLDRIFEVKPIRDTQVIQLTISPEHQSAVTSEIVPADSISIRTFKANTPELPMRVYSQEKTEVVTDNSKLLLEYIRNNQQQNQLMMRNLSNEIASLKYELYRIKPSAGLNSTPVQQERIQYIQQPAQNLPAQSATVVTPDNNSIDQLNEKINLLNKRIDSLLISPIPDTVIKEPKAVLPKETEEIRFQQQWTTDIQETQKQQKLILEKLEALLEPPAPTPAPAPAPVIVKDSSPVAAKPSYTITFAINSSKIDQIHRQNILALFSKIELSNSQKIVLSGFSDKSGNPSYNLLLSKKRVDAVIKVLLSLGISESSILQQYFGSSRSNQVSENDRKVEIKIVNNLP